MIALLLAAAVAVPQEREQRFLELLRTYPQRAPAETFREVAALIDAGDFAERDRAEYWIGSARLAVSELDGARAWFARVARDYPSSPWAERALLGLGDAAAAERKYGLAIEWYKRAAGTRDAAVRELARIDLAQMSALRRRQIAAFCAGLVSLGIAVFFLAQGRRALWPLPSETRIVLPVLAVLALLSTRVDPAPRSAVLMIVGGGAVLTALSGARLRAARHNRWGHAALGVVALCGLAFFALYRADLLGMAMETFRAGPE